MISQDEHVRGQDGIAQQLFAEGSQKSNSFYLSGTFLGNIQHSSSLPPTIVHKIDESLLQNNLSLVTGILPPD